MLGELKVCFSQGGDIVFYTSRQVWGGGGTRGPNLFKGAEQLSYNGCIKGKIFLQIYCKNDAKLRQNMLTAKHYSRHQKEFNCL